MTEESEKWRTSEIMNTNLLESWHHRSFQARWNASCDVSQVSTWKLKVARATFEINGSLNLQSIGRVRVPAHIRQVVIVIDKQMRFLSSWRSVRGMYSQPPFDTTRTETLRNSVMEKFVVQIHTNESYHVIKKFCTTFVFSKGWNSERSRNVAK